MRSYDKSSAAVTLPRDADPVGGGARAVIVPRRAQAVSDEDIAAIEERYQERRRKQWVDRAWRNRERRDGR